MRNWSGLVYQGESCGSVFVWMGIRDSCGSVFMRVSKYIKKDSRASVSVLRKTHAGQYIKNDSCGSSFMRVNFHADAFSCGSVS